MGSELYVLFLVCNCSGYSKNLKAWATNKTITYVAVPLCSKEVLSAQQKLRVAVGVQNTKSLNQILIGLRETLNTWANAIASLAATPSFRSTITPHDVRICNETWPFALSAHSIKCSPIARNAHRRFLSKAATGSNYFIVCQCWFNRNMCVICPARWLKVINSYFVA